jgi:hypothetical protein
MRHIERTLAFQKEFSKADKVRQELLNPHGLASLCL